MPAMPASTYSHSSEIRDLRSTQFSRETLICHIFLVLGKCRQGLAQELPTNQELSCAENGYLH